MGRNRFFGSDGVDGLPQIGKIGFVLGHNVFLGVLAVVQVLGGEISWEHRPELKGREMIQHVVVRFKVQLPAGFQQLQINLQLSPVGEPALKLPVLMPGVAEIDINLVQLLRLKHQR